MTEGFIRAWHTTMVPLIRSKPGAEGIFEDPRRILNMDETEFRLSGDGGRESRVLAMRGSRHVQRKSAGKGPHITVCCTVGADGTWFNPVIITPSSGKAKRPTQRTVNMEAFPEAEYLCTSSGWQNEETFHSYIVALHGWLVEKRTPLPVVLFVDGHYSHQGPLAMRFALEHQIIVYKLPPNCTNIMQPLDVSLYAVAKDVYQREVRAYQQTGENLALNKKQFPVVYRRLHEEMGKHTDRIKQSFEVTGLCPPDPDRPHYDRLPSARVKDWYEDVDLLEGLDLTVNLTNQMTTPPSQEARPGSSKEVCINLVIGEDGILTASTPTPRGMKPPPKLRLVTSPHGSQQVKIT